MSDFVKLLLLSGIGAGIGWITNYIAIKLLFRPLNPITVGNIKFQGLIPKRKEEIAKSIGKVVEEELLSMQDLTEKLLEEENLAPVKVSMKYKIQEVIEQKLPSIIPNTFKNMMISYVDKMVDEEGDRIIMEFIEDVSSEQKNRIRLSHLVEEKINNFELDKIESIVFEIASKELKHIEAIGAVLGFSIGLVQGAIVILT